MRLPKISKKVNYILLLLVIFLFHTAVSYQILKKSQTARAYDENSRLTYGLSLYRDIFLSPKMEINEKINRIFALRGQLHPHLVEFTEAVSWKILALAKIMDEDLMILLTNSIFLLILLISIYGIGAVVYNSNAGLSAALLTSMFPLVFGHSRIVMLDYPLMCMITLSFYLLMKTNRFQSVFYSIFSGIVFGLAQLTKESAIIFICAPLVYYFIKAYSSEKDKKITLRNFIITIILFLIIAFGNFCFASNNLEVFKRYLGVIAAANSAELLYYLENVIYLMGPFILFLSLPLLWSYFSNFKKREKFAFIWLFIPIIIFSLSPNKCIRFLFPILPAFALIITQELFTNNYSTHIKRIYGFILISSAILQYALFNYGILTFKNDLPTQDKGILSVEKDKYLPARIVLLDIFLKEAGSCDREKKILFLSDIGQVFCPLEFEFQLRQLPFHIICPMANDWVAAARYPNNAYWQRQILKTDYIVNIIGYKNYSFTRYYYNITIGLRKGFARYKDKFQIMAKIKLFDGSNLYVYRKK